jgi:Ni,Fe-hydrogenase maturation factor
VIKVIGIGNRLMMDDGIAIAVLSAFEMCSVNAGIFLTETPVNN